MWSIIHLYEPKKLKKENRNFFDKTGHGRIM